MNLTQCDACLTTVKIKEVIERFEELWLDSEVQKVITEDEWLEFIEAIGQTPVE